MSQPPQDVLSSLHLLPTEFEAMERDTHLVLAELAGDQTLERFKLEYERLYRALKNSHENERRLTKRCKELNREIQNNANNVQEALQIASEDNETIKALKNEIDIAWKMIDAARDKDERAKATISSLRNEIAQLSKIVEQGAGMSVNQENTIKELMEQRETLQREVQTSTLAVQKLKDENRLLEEQVQKVEGEQALKEHEMRQLRELITQNKNDAEREDRRRRRLKGELEQAQAKSKQLSDEVERKEKEIEDTRTDHEEKTRANQEYQHEIEDMKKDSYMIKEGCKKLESSIRDQVEAMETQKAEKSQAEAEMARHRDELVHQRQTKKQLKRDIEGLEKDTRKQNLRVSEAVDQKEAATKNVYNLSKELDILRRKCADDREVIETLSQELIRQGRSVTKIKEVTEIKQSTMQALSKEESDFEDDLRKKKAEVEELAGKISELEKIKEKLGIEAALANEKYNQCFEEVKLKNNLIAELQKKNAEAENNLKLQQTRYEAVRSDRNLYSKNLIESQDKISELRRSFKIYHNQIEQLKEEINEKTSTLKDFQLKCSQLSREYESAKLQKEKKEKKLQNLREKKKNLETEMEKLRHIIFDAEQKREEQKKEYERRINERDHLGTQLVRRNDELALLHEKIKIQQNALANGEVLYYERMNDIRLLKFKINDLKREKEIAEKQAAQIEDLKQQIFQFETDLLEHRTQVKAFSEELENTLNSHRYRRLGGADPDKTELITKVQTLQRRLISKTEEVVEHDVLIQEKQKLYEELQTLLNMQPGPEMAEALSRHQQLLKAKTRQMKSLASELNMLQAQLNEQKYDIEKHTRTLQELKRKYYEKRRADEH